MISVIVPVYGTEMYLSACVDSILNQTVRDLELLLIDDGSPDHSGEICDEYARKDGRVRVFHTENHGVSAARNLGIREARGEYIGFVDSDDWIEPDMYEVLLKNIEAAGADISVCGTWYEYGFLSEAARDRVDSVFIGTEAISALLRNHLKNLVWNKLYRRTLWNNIAFPEGHIYEDVATVYKLVLMSEKVVSTSGCLYHYRQVQNSISTSNTMKNLIDFWTGFFNRYMDLMSLPAVCQNEELVSILRQETAKGAVKAWWWVYKMPRESRDMDHLKTVSAFVRITFPVFGEPGWDFYLRVSVFLARYTNEFAFAVGYYLNIIHRFFRKLNRFARKIPV